MRRLDLAEESLQDAFTAAVQRWPEDGPPRNPAGWLLTTARRRAVDRLRREASDLRRLPLLVTEEAVSDMDHVELDEGYAVPDERLRLVFTCCHPALSMESRVALTLRFVAGLTTPEIARLFLVAEPTTAARLTRAKKKIAAAGIPFRVPDADDLPDRLAGALAVIYLVFTEGYAATSGDRLLREELASEAIRLGRVLGELMPGEPEVTALLALMVLHHARRRARIDPAGRLVLLPDQDRDLWRWDEIGEGLALLELTARSQATSPYALQAAIAAEHAKARRASDTDWPAIADLYAQLERVTGSAVVRLNRAVAVAEAAGPRAGLALLGDLDEALPRHHLLPAARAELLRRLGRNGEAIVEYGRALALVGNDVERAFLLSRRAELERAGGTDE